MKFSVCPRCVIGLALSVVVPVFFVPIAANAADVRIIYPEFEPEIEGKEVDWIYGDYLMKNDLISLTIGAPIRTRDANLTVRNVGASILDLTLNQPSNDQLSVYIPAGGRYQFHDPSLVEIGKTDSSVYWQCKSSKSLKGDGTVATVRYSLADGMPFVEVTVQIEGDAADKVDAFDGVRADNTFSTGSIGVIAYCSDPFFRQTIGFKSMGGDQAPTWKKARPLQLRYASEQVRRAGQKLRWGVQLYPATSQIDLKHVGENSDAVPAMQTFQFNSEIVGRDRESFVLRGELQITRQGADAETFRLQTDDAGVAHTRLAAGNYRVKANVPGYSSAETQVEVREEAKVFAIPLQGFSGFVADVVDAANNPIPAKLTIYSVGGKHPDYGPDSTRTFVKNCVYSVHGKARCPLEPGEYEVFFSHGPEFNRVQKTITVAKGQTQSLNVELERVVDTSGWVSTELHSHSTPSGDNTSDQYGRVENLLCEHLEFAPCTEHNRISSYTPHLEQMGLVDLMATCAGMELTGSLLPVNHQNAFPLHHHPHTQNGGGPRVSSNPVVQIERIAMWDEGAEKVVQMNHPNLHQIYGDLDVDGKPDRGFRKMLQWTDVIEIHPLETIFQDVAGNPPNVREMRIPLFQWMQLLNQGYRIPGVVNTDAHYNHHGSGWLRNWFACSTDDPKEISTEEMIRQAEAGHIVMSTGPFLNVKGGSASSDRLAIPGDDLKATDGKVTLHVSVQCPNWLDVNRVQVFVNGRPSEAHNRTRKNAPDLFGDAEAVTKFDSTFEVELEEDAHLIVATIGEGMTMEQVMGARYGKKPPIAVANPIFVDVDGNGFQHNHDELGLPLPKE